MNSMRPAAIFEEMISSAPGRPGIYKMFDAAGNLLYVGKAKNLIKRLRQYIDSEKLEYHKILMRRQVARVEWQVAATEQEALILEQHAIKTEKPKYNIILRDDKMYPFLALSNDKFPRLFRFRQKKITQKRNVYGPFPFISDLDETIRLTQRVCQIRTCTNNVFNSRKRPCILFQIGRCSAPCCFPNDGYKDQIKLAKKIMSGHIRQVVSDLAKKMKSAAAAADYEAAAKAKGQIDSLQSTVKPAMILKQRIKKVPKKSKKRKKK
jgi:excinuclease ABC subunit C